jgi:hypothetical protein
MPSRDSSTATRWSSLNRLVSLSQRTEPAPPLRSTSSGLGPGMKEAPEICVSWPTFSSSVMRPRSAWTLSATCSSESGGSE